jgi:hypothetical protein
VSSKTKRWRWLSALLSVPIAPLGRRETRLPALAVNAGDRITAPAALDRLGTTGAWALPSGSATAQRALG